MRKLSKNETQLLEVIKDKKQIQGKLKVAIYARKSSEDEFETALDSQIQQCKKLIELNSELLQLDESHIFSEEKKSGMFTDNREKFQEVISLVEDKEIDVVLVHTPERFSRNIKDFQTYQNILRNNDAILLSTDIPTEESAMGEFIQNITISASQMFVRQCAEKTFRSLENKAKDCRITGGMPNYGYKYEADRYVKNPEESVAIEIIFNGVVDGKTYSDIQDELDALGFRTRQRKKFSKSTINDILHNVKYCGTYLYNKKGGKRKKHRVLLGEYDEVRIEDGITEPIISKETFNRVQEILNQRTQCRKKNTKPNHLLTGLIRCKQCGGFYVGNTRLTRKKEKYFSYICKNRLGSNKSCKAKEIKAEYIENYVKEVVFQVINSLVKSNALKESIFNEYLKVHKTKIKTQNRDIQDFNKKIDRTLDLMTVTKNKNTLNLLQEKLAELQQHKKRKQDLCDKYKLELQTISDTISKIKNGDLISKNVLFANPYKTRELFLLIIKEILIDDASDNIEIHLW